MIIVYRLGDGRIQEHWLQMNISGLMDQLTHLAELHLGVQLGI